MTLTHEALRQEAPHDAEALFPEARRRRRRIRIIVGVIVLVAAVAIAIPIGGFTGRHHPGAGIPSSQRVLAPLLADARRTCDGTGLRAISSSRGKAHLYGAYLTTVRQAVNWPTKIYPLSGSPTPTTLGSDHHPINNAEGWPLGLNSSRPATICIFTGNFVYTVPSMQGVPTDERAKVFLVYVGVIGSGVSITPANSVPRTPVPVA